MSENDNNTEVEYTSDWVGTHLMIAQRCGISSVDSNVVYRFTVDEKSRNRKIRAIDVLTDNLSRLDHYFTTQERTPSEIVEGRRMYRQYKLWIDMLKRQVEQIDCWLSSNPPF
jgi:hypothetical protein